MRTVTGACVGSGIAPAAAFAAARLPLAEDGGVVVVAIKISDAFFRVQKIGMQQIQNELGTLEIGYQSRAKSNRPRRLVFPAMRCLVPSVSRFPTSIFVIEPPNFVTEAAKLIRN
jgi:hypothetical protein